MFLNDSVLNFNSLGAQPTNSKVVMTTSFLRKYCTVAHLDQGESNQRLKKWIFGNKKSLARLEEQLVSAIESSPVSLISLVVHVLRRGADVRKAHDSHLFVYPETRRQHVDDTLHKFIDTRPPTVTKYEATSALGVSCMPLPVTLRKQFDVINAISNDAKKSYYGMTGTVNVPKNVSMDNVLLYQRPKNPKNPKSAPLCYPTSLRNRLLFFLLQDNVEMVRGLIRFWADGCPNAVGSKPRITEHDNLKHEPPLDVEWVEKQKHFCTSRVDVTAQPKPSRSVFDNFQQRLRLDGFIIWRRLTARSDCGVFVMNSLDRKSAQIVSNSFEHVEYVVSGETVSLTRCSCSVFTYLYDMRQHEAQVQNRDSSLPMEKACVHGRFLLTYLKELCLDPKLLDADHKSALYEKIKNEKQLGDVVILPEFDGKYALKMSVVGADNGLLAFMHLSPDKQKLSCMSSGCSYFTQNTKSSPVSVLLDTDNPKHSKFVCQHMRQLLQHKDQWVHYCAAERDGENNDGDTETELDLNDSDLYFDQESGLWVYSQALGNAKRLPDDSPLHVE